MRLAAPRLHRPTVVGRMRADPGPLLLMGLVVALTTALTSAVTPLMARTSDRALADVVRHAGPLGAVVATFPRADEDVGRRVRDPRAGARFRAEALRTQRQLPASVAAVVRPGIASITTPALQLLGAGPGRYLTIAYVTSAAGGPHVHYVAGGPPQATGRGERRAPADAASWTVQVALSRASANALGLSAGDRVSAKDEQSRPVAAQVSGIFVADDATDAGWQASTGLLHPESALSEGVQRTAAAALVSSSALPDLRLAVPSDDLIERVSLTPRAAQLRWDGSAELVRAIASLKASPNLALGKVAWDSALDDVLNDGRAQVSAARGQADVLLAGLLACALLVLWQVAELLVRRRTGSVVLTRERGGTLVGIAAELFLESAVVAVGGAVVGLLLTRVTVGDAGWGWWVPIPLVAALAAAVTGAVVAFRATDPRRTPANRTARRRAARARRSSRFLLVAAVVAAAGLTLVALRQRGVLAAGDGGDPTPATAPMWWTLAGALVVIPAIPLGARLLLEATRRSTGGASFFVAARMRDAGSRALPLVVIAMTVAQLGFALALSSTEQRGQAAGALLSVGGDARVTLPSNRSAAAVARRVATAPGVRAAVAARVEDGVRATSRQTADTVRLVVVGAAAYERLLAVSALTDAPQLNRLNRGHGARVPALVLGGTAGLRDRLSVRGPDEGAAAVSVVVVGTAPRVQGSVDPVVVVDATRYARAGGEATPHTVWAVGRGAAAGVRDNAGREGALVLYDDVLAARRSAPLASGLVRLASVSAALLLLFAVLAVVLSAASEAVPRGESLGRLRSLGLRDGQLWRVLAGELAAPVCLGTLAGIALGIGAAVSMFSHLSLERITGQVGPPDLHVPLWGLGGIAVLAATVVLLTQLEWTRLRRVVLGELLRGGAAR